MAVGLLWSLTSYKVVSYMSSFNLSGEIDIIFVLQTGTVKQRDIKCFDQITYSKSGSLNLCVWLHLNITMAGHLDATENLLAL